jgi:hypothetical protein
MLSARQGGHSEDALVVFASDGGTPREEWNAMLVAIDAKLGRPLSYELGNWNVNVGTSPAGTGTTVSLVYAIHYERAEGIESLVLFKPSGSTVYRIIGLNVNSPALLLDPARPAPAPPPDSEAL